MKNRSPDKDIETVKRQLGIKSVSIRNIIERCKHGYPQVVLLNPSVSVDNNPVLNYQSIINILWLTCPYLNYRIHELEDKKFVKRIEGIIEQDFELNLKMRNAHANFYFMRNMLCRGAGISAEEHNDLFIKGIGGIKNLKTLKCLHLHYAHSRICKDNVAGRIVSLLLKGNTNCDDFLCGNL